MNYAIINQQNTHSSILVQSRTPSVVAVLFVDSMDVHHD